MEKVCSIFYCDTCGKEMEKREGNEFGIKLPPRLYQKSKKIEDEEDKIYAKIFIEYKWYSPFLNDLKHHDLCTECSIDILEFAINEIKKGKSD